LAPSIVGDGTDKGSYPGQANDMAQALASGKIEGFSEVTGTYEELQAMANEGRLIVAVLNSSGKTQAESELGWMDYLAIAAADAAGAYEGAKIGSLVAPPYGTVVGGVFISAGASWLAYKDCTSGSTSPSSGGEDPIIKFVYNPFDQSGFEHGKLMNNLFIDSSNTLDLEFNINDLYSRLRDSIGSTSNGYITYLDVDNTLTQAQFVTAVNDVVTTLNGLDFSNSNDITIFVNALFDINDRTLVIEYLNEITGFTNYEQVVEYSKEMEAFVLDNTIPGISEDRLLSFYSVYRGSLPFWSDYKFNNI